MFRRQRGPRRCQRSESPALALVRAFGAVERKGYGKRLLSTPRAISKRSRPGACCNSSQEATGMHPGRCASVRFAGREIGSWARSSAPAAEIRALSAPVLFEVLTAPLLEGSPPRFEGVSRMPAVRREMTSWWPIRCPRGAPGCRPQPPPGHVRESKCSISNRGKGVDPGQKKPCPTDSYAGY